MTTFSVGAGQRHYSGPHNTSQYRRDTTRCTSTSEFASRAREFASDRLWAGSEANSRLGPHCPSPRLPWRRRRREAQAAGATDPRSTSGHSSRTDWQGNRRQPRPHVLGLVTQHDPRLRSRWSGLHRPDSQRGAPNPDSRTRGGRVRLKAEAPGRGSPLDYRETRAESIGQRGLPTVALTSPLASQSLACIAATTTPSRTQKARKTRAARSPSTSTSSSAEPWPQYSIPRSY